MSTSRSASPTTSAVEPQAKRACTEGSSIELGPGVADMHVHMRQGHLMEMVAPQLEKGGVTTAFVMPNLRPPVQTAAAAVEYKAKLEKLAPNVQFLMSLYLGPDLTVEELERAAASGAVYGVKSYPRGVTTNSDSGIESYEVYYEQFAAMERLGLVLNLHGEIPSDPDNDICVLNAEKSFLKHLVKLHKDFPNLKIVLEHATTADAVETVKSLGPTVGCTITVHHLDLIVDDWCNQAHNFCKPVAKFPHDRKALREAVLSGNPKFFLGSDSAPHPRDTKEVGTKLEFPKGVDNVDHDHGDGLPKCTVAGVYTGNEIAVYTAHILSKFNALDKLYGFAVENGRRFYFGNDWKEKLPEKLANKTVSVTKSTESTLIPIEYKYQDEINGNEVVRSVVPFMPGKKLDFKLSA